MDEETPIEVKFTCECSSIILLKETQLTIEFPVRNRRRLCKDCYERWVRNGLKSDTVTQNNFKIHSTIKRSIQAMEPQNWKDS